MRWPTSRTRGSSSPATRSTRSSRCSASRPGSGVADRVEWRLGFLPDEQIPQLMAEATLVALPYRKIDSSGVLATALGHGRPAVVTDVGGLPDAIRDFGAGRVVPPERPSGARRRAAGAARRATSWRRPSRARGRAPCAHLGRGRRGARSGLPRGRRGEARRSACSTGCWPCSGSSCSRRSSRGSRSGSCSSRAGR